MACFAWAWAPTAACCLSSTSLVVCLSGTSLHLDRGAHGARTSRYPPELLEHQWFLLKQTKPACTSIIYRGNILDYFFCDACLTFNVNRSLAKVSVCVCVGRKTACLSASIRQLVTWRMLCGFVFHVCSASLLAQLLCDHVYVWVCVKSVNRVSRLISSPKRSLSFFFPPFFHPSLLPTARIWGDQPRVEDIAGEKEENKR